MLPAERGAGEQVRTRSAQMDPQLRWRLAAVLAEPLADELTRGQALAWGALLHDAAKPLHPGDEPPTVRA